MRRDRRSFQHARREALRQHRLEGRRDEHHDEDSVLSIRLSSIGCPAALEVLYATSVAASVAATCGNVSDHIVLRAVAA